MDSMRSVAPALVDVVEVTGPRTCMEPRDGFLDLKIFLKARFISMHVDDQSEWERALDYISGVGHNTALDKYLPYNTAKWVELNCDDTFVQGLDSWMNYLTLGPSPIHIWKILFFNIIEASIFKLFLIRVSTETPHDHQSKWHQMLNLLDESSHPWVCLSTGLQVQTFLLSRGPFKFLLDLARLSKTMHNLIN